VVAFATLVVVGAAALLGLLRAVPAHAATDCVAVLVDARQLGGELRTGCAQGNPDNGLQALAKAGFSYTPRPRDGLICQIDSTPACGDTTSSTYWSYWYRSPGSSSWVYANEGAGTHDPPPGSTEAWVWQDGGRKQPPGVAASTICPQLKASPQPTKTTQRPTKASASATKKAAAPSQATGRTTSAPNSSAKPKPTSARATTSPSASPSATPPSQPAGSGKPTTTTPTSADVDDSSGGAISGPVGLALGGVLVVGLGTATALRARRNHSS
jgi:hypothetical protein